MAIKIQRELTVITPAFEQAIGDVYKARVALIFKELKQSEQKGDWYHQRDRRRYGPVLSRLYPLARQEPAALSKERVRLRALPYLKFDLGHDHEGQEFLVGTTPSLIAHDVGKKKLGYYDFGPYEVWVGLRNIMHGGMDMIHFVPQREPFALDRHPHQVLHSQPEFHPTDKKPYSCWFQYANIVNHLCRSADFPGLFRVLHAFVATFSSDHWLCNPDFIVFATELGQDYRG